MISINLQIKDKNISVNMGKGIDLYFIEINQIKITVACNKIKQLYINQILYN